MNTMNKDLLSKTLGIEFERADLPSKQELVPVEKTKTEHDDKEINNISEDAQADYKRYRDTMDALIQEGLMAVKDARTIAASNEMAMSFQAVAQLIKAVSETTEKMYDVHEKTKKLKEIGDVPGKKIMDDGNVNIEKAVFVGTPTELMRQLKQKK